MNPNLVLDIRGNKTSPGAELTVYNRNGGANQQFRFHDKYVIITSSVHHHCVIIASSLSPPSLPNRFLFTVSLRWEALGKCWTFTRTSSMRELLLYSILARRVTTVTKGKYHYYLSLFSTSFFSLFCYLCFYLFFYLFIAYRFSLRWEAGPQDCIKLKDHPFVLDVQGSKNESGTPVIIWTNNWQANQKWTLERVP